MERDRLRQVKIRHTIAANHQKRLTEQLFNIFDAACGPKRGLLLDGVAHAHAKLRPILKIIPQNIRQIVKRRNNFINAMVFEQINNVLCDRSVQQWHHGFWKIAGEGTKPCP